MMERLKVLKEEATVMGNSAAWGSRGGGSERRKQQQLEAAKEVAGKEEADS